MDLGRFELFRWQFNQPPFSLLLDHTDRCITSSLSVGMSGAAVSIHLHRLTMPSKWVCCLYLAPSDILLCVALQLGETKWAQRVAVRGPGGAGVFEFTMSQRCGGRKDGFWFCDSLLHAAEADAEAAFHFSSAALPESGQE